MEFGPPQAKNAIEKKESLDLLSMSDESRINLALTTLGFKRASDVLVRYEDTDDQAARAAKDAAAEKYFSDNLLVFLANHEKSQNASGGWKEYIVGKDKQDVLSFQQAWNLPETIVTSQHIGELSGFPKTSIDAYVNHEDSMRTEDLPEDMQNQEFTIFSNLNYSRNHWREELGVVRQWAEAIQERYPALYERYVREHFMGKPAGQ